MDGKAGYGTGLEVREFRFLMRSNRRNPSVTARGVSAAEALAAHAAAHGGIIDGLNLNGLILDGLVLTDVVVRDCSFDGASLQDLRVRRCLLQDVSFVGTDFSSSGREPRRRSEFRDSKFQRVRAYNATFGCARFNGCLFSASSFRNCDFYGAVIRLCDVVPGSAGNDFSGCVFDYATLRGTVVTYADMRGTSWRHTRMLSADGGRDCKSSILLQVDLRGARFKQAKFCLLRGSSSLDLRGTDALGLRLLTPGGRWFSDAAVQIDAGTRTSVGWLARAWRWVSGRLSVRRPGFARGNTALRMAELEADWLSRSPGIAEG